MRFPPILASLVLAGCASASAEEPVPPAFVKDEGKSSDVFDPDFSAPKLVRVQVEYIEAPHEAVTELLLKPEAKDAGKLRALLQDMIRRKEAKILDTQIMTGRSNQKATSESVGEFIYPTEYEGQIEIPEPKAEKPREPRTKVAPFLPTAFETRNTGSTLEIEPTLGEAGDIIDLRFVSEIVWHTGNTLWAEQKDAAGNNAKVEMPEFYSLRSTTAVTCANGRYILNCVLSPKTPEGRMDTERKVLQFVKCDVITVK